MAKMILMDEYHLTVFSPRGLSEPEYDAIRQSLDDRRFHADLDRAVRRVIQRHPPLLKVRVKVSR